MPQNRNTGGNLTGHTFGTFGPRDSRFPNFNPEFVKGATEAQLIQQRIESALATGTRIIDSNDPQAAPGTRFVNKSTGLAAPPFEAPRGVYINSTAGNFGVTPLILKFVGKDPWGAALDVNITCTTGQAIEDVPYCFSDIEYMEVVQADDTSTAFDIRLSDYFALKFAPAQTDTPQASDNYGFLDALLDGATDGGSIVNQTAGVSEGWTFNPVTSYAGNLPMDVYYLARTPLVKTTW